MRPEAIRELLEGVRRGATGVEEAVSALRDLPFAELGFATVDHHRALRNGFPEVVLGSGKTPEQMIAIFREIDRHEQTVLATRVSSEDGAVLTRAIPQIDYDPVSRTAVLMRSGPRDLGRGTIAVVTAGTSDLPVARRSGGHRHGVR